MEIPHATEMRSITIDARDNERVDDILKVIVCNITESAKKGDSSVIMSGARYCISDGDIALKIACDILIERGYSVEAYVGSETEETCFGTGYVQVEGMRVSW